MINILKKIEDKFLVFYLIVNLLYILVGSYLVMMKYIFIKIFSYGYIVFLILNILIILYMFFQKKYVKNKIDIFLVLIIIFAIISTIFAYDTNKAFFGEWKRYEGLLTICYYMSILFITSFLKKEDKKKIVYAILIFGFIQLVYAVCQKFNLFNVHIKTHKNERWVTGFATNPNFFGTLMLLCSGFSIGLFINSKKIQNIILYLILIYLYLVGCLLSNALSSIVGLIFIMMILIIYSIKKKHLKKYLILLLLIVSTMLFLHTLKATTIISDLVQTKNETLDIAKGNFNNEYGTYRMEVWKKTIKVVPKYLLHGVGVDNFANIIDGHSIKIFRYLYDKAHNEYLQILVTMGIFSLISYLCMHFLAIKDGIKSKEIYLLLPVIGYLVQAQFNISVIEVAPIFYISLGLLVDRKSVK